MVTKDEQGRTVVGSDPPGTHKWDGVIRTDAKPFKSRSRAVIEKRKVVEAQMRREVQGKFLELLPQFCTVMGTANALGVSRFTIFQWLADDPEFKAAYEAAKSGPVVDTLEAEAFRRGHDGYEEPVYQGGEQVGTVRKYSDTLLIMLLNGAAPAKYRKQVEHLGPDGGPIQIAHLIKIVREEPKAIASG